MTKKARNILFIIFILIFIILFPIILALANGYRFNLSRPIRLNTLLQKTGMFIIDSTPNGAEIKINSDSVSKNKKIPAEHLNTPAKIKNLLPGKYKIELIKEGYYPWEKELEIKGGESTFAENIYLIKTDIPINLLSREIEYLKLSPDKKKIIAISETLDLIHLDNKNLITNVSVELSNKNDFEWSPDSKKFIIDKKIYNLNNISEPQDLGKIFGEDIKNLKWFNKFNEVYFKQNNFIYNYNIDFKKITKIYELPNIQDYLINDNFLFLIINDAEKIQFYVINLNNNEKLINIELPFSSGYEFTKPIGRHINIFDKKYKFFYQINPFLNFNPIEEIISNIKIFKWISDTKMLYANDFEIWIIDFDSGEKTLLTRIGKEISDIIWHPNNNHILYSSKNKLNIIELDNRERRNITEIGSYNNIQNLEISKNGQELYFNAKIGNQQGLYKLIIN